jgi:hypothetical protein
MAEKMELENVLEAEAYLFRTLEVNCRAKAEMAEALARAEADRKSSDAAHGQ